MTTGCWRLRWAWLACCLSLLAATLGLADTNGVLFTPQEIDAAGTRYGEMAQRRLLTLQKLIAGTAGLTEMERLEKVNTFFNFIPYVTDAKHWQQEDYWATPLELLGSNGGDCEDYSIAKYLTLRQMGVDDDKLRISYVKAIKLDQAHMVLTYYPAPDAEPFILDNLNKQLLPASERPDLLPIYSFNASGLWVAKGPSGGKRAGGSDRLERWSDLRARLNNGR